MLGFNRQTDYDKHVAKLVARFCGAGPLERKRAATFALQALAEACDQEKRAESMFLPRVDPKGTERSKWDRWGSIGFLLEEIEANSAIEVTELAVVIAQTCLTANRESRFLLADEIARLLGTAYGLAISVQRQFPKIAARWVEEGLAVRHHFWEGTPDESDEPTELELELFKRIMDYGVTNDESMIDGLRSFYASATDRLSEHERMRLLLHVIKMAEQKVASVNAFNPFLFLDPSHSIVSTASLHAAGIWPGNEEDATTGVNALLKLALDHSAKGGSESASVAIVSGLLMLSDRRVVNALKHCWRGFSPDSAAELAKASGPRLNAPVADWLIDWLEDSEGGSFGAVAAALSRFADRARTEGVFEVRRAIPIWSAVEGEVIQVLQEWTFEEFAGRIRPRLLQIAADETAPRVMHRVLQDWGIDNRQRTMPGIAMRRSHSVQPRNLLALMGQRTNTSLECSAILPLNDDDFLSSEGQLLLNWAFFNPYGPRWRCIGLLPTHEPETSILFYRMLNPFAQQACGIAVLHGDECSSGPHIGSIVQRLFDQEMIGDINGEPVTMIGDVAPSLVLPMWKDAEFLGMAPGFFTRSPRMRDFALSRTVRWTQEHYGEPWDRASAQREFLSSCAKPDGSLAFPQEEPPTRDTIQDWFRLIRTETHEASELLNFPAAWHGSIDQAAPQLDQTAFTFWQLNSFLCAYGFTTFTAVAEAFEHWRDPPADASASNSNPGDDQSGEM